MKYLLLCSVLALSSSMSFAKTSSSNESAFEKAISSHGYKTETKIYDCALEMDSDLGTPVATCTIETVDGLIGIAVFGKLKIDSNGKITHASLISHDAD